MEDKEFWGEEDEEEYKEEEEEYEDEDDEYEDEGEEEEEVGCRAAPPIAAASFTVPVVGSHNQQLYGKIFAELKYFFFD